MIVAAMADPASAMTALSWRVPRGESWVHGRSRCPGCEHVLGVRDLIPGDVEFHRMPKWQRDLKRHGGGRTTWRVLLANP